MLRFHEAVQWIGGLMCAIGVAGLFLHISQDDGALAIAGAIVFGAGAVSHAGVKVE